MSSEGIAAKPGMTYSRWLDLLRRFQSTTPFLSCDPTKPLLDRDMFSVIRGPSIAAISVGKRQKGTELAAFSWQAHCAPLWIITTQKIRWYRLLHLRLAV
jgi:hypothetical protein